MPEQPIQSDAELEVAFARLDALWGAPIGTPEGDDLDALVDAIEAYENVHHRLPDVDVG